MYNPSKHISLIGFKHVGKSVIGANLAKALGMPFIDTDQQIETYHQHKFNQDLNCRQIVEFYGLNVHMGLNLRIIQYVLCVKCLKYNTK